MKTALRRGLGTVAALLALLALPGAILAISYVIGGIGILAMPWQVIGTLSGWLTVALCVGLALLVEPIAAKAVLLLAGVSYAARMMSDLLILAQLIASASSALTASGPLQLAGVGWLWPLSVLLLALGILLGLGGHRWLSWLAVGALALELASYGLSMATTGPIAGSIWVPLAASARELGYVAMLVGLAWALLVRERGSGTVEQAHRADAVS